MAQPTSSRNALITLGIAAATLVVVFGVLSGPSIIECSSDEDGLGQCLRGKLDGVLGGAPVVVAEPETPEAPAAQEPDVQVASGAPAAPSLGLLNAEPDGAVVVSGTAAPGEEVSIYANGKLFGTAKAEPDGDWAFVSEDKLQPGGTEITVGGPDKSLATQAFVVILDKDPAVAPQVIASVPGKADEVLKGVPLAPTSTDAAEPQVATAPEVEAVEPEPESATPAVDAAPVVDVAAIDAGRMAAEMAIDNPVTVVATLPAPAPAEPLVDEAAVAAGAAAAALAAANPVTPPSPVDAAATAAGAAAALAAVANPIEVADIAVPEDLATGPDPLDTQAAFEAGRAAAEQAADNPVTQEIVVAAVAPEPAVTPPMPRPTIEAIEIDGATDYFAGGGEEGATVRIYVDDKLAGESVVKDGRYLVESAGTLTQPSQRVRAEMLAPGSDTVGSTASVDFVLDMPATPDVTEPVTNVAAVEAGKAAAEAAALASESAPQVPDAPAEPEIDVAAVDAGRAAAEVAVVHDAAAPEATEAETTPVTDTAALDAGRAAAALAAANPVSQAVTAVAALEAEPVVEPVAEVPQVDAAALEAGRVAAEVAAANPQAQAVASVEMPAPELIADSGASEDLVAIEAGTAAAEEALANPQTQVVAKVQEPIEPVADPADSATKVAAATEAGSQAAKAALAEPHTQVVAAVEAPVEPVAEPAAERVPATDLAAVEAGRSDAETAATNLEAEEAEVAEMPAAEPTSPAPETAAEATVAPAVEPEPDQVAVVETPEAAAVEEIPTIHAGPMTAADLRMFSDGKVIIRRGDTLWDIARRVYGNPYKYRSIYRANRNIVRRPSRIYPGQVLVLPEIADGQN